MDSISDDARKDRLELHSIPQSEEAQNERVETLHFFFTDLPPVSRLRTFPNLKELIIMGQSVSDLAFLKGCPKLSKLWICESGLTSMKGLKCATNLEELYLFDNRLTLVEGLEQMHSLSRLWLNDNDISDLSGLQNLKGLRNLNVAGNQIRRLNASLTSCTQLECINLSGNHLYDLYDFLSLSLLPKFTFLRYNDAEFPPNSIASSPHSSLALVHHIPQLSNIDGFDLDDSLISYLQSIISDKKLFYFAKFRHQHNFLLRTHRNLLLLKKRLSRPINERLRLLDLQIRSLEAYTTRALNLSKTTSQEIKILQKSLGDIRVRGCWWKSKLNSLEAEYEHYTDALSGRLKLNLCLHTAELQMFGSLIVTAVDRSSDLFENCKRFCQLRMCWHDRWLDGFSELRLNNLWQLRNSLLNDRVSERNESGDCIKEDLLFYNGIFSSDHDFCHLGEFLRSGFSTNETGGNYTFTTLLNRILIWDDNDDERMFNTSFLVLLVRALTGDDKKCVRTGIVLSPKIPTSNDGDKLFCSCCLAHFDYVFSETVDLIPEFVAELELVSRSTISQISAFMNREKSRASTLTESIGSLNCVGISLDGEVLKTRPDFPPPPDLSKDDAEKAFRHSYFSIAAVQTCEMINEINFHGTGFKALRSLRNFPVLRILTLSNCGLTSLHDLSLAFLETLDVSHNAIRSTRGLGHCPSLLILDVNWNLLSNLASEVHYLLSVAENLTTLRLEYNPWFRSERVNELAHSLLAPSGSTFHPHPEGCSSDTEAFRKTHTFSTSRNYMLTLWPILTTPPRNLCGRVLNLDFCMQFTQLWSCPPVLPTNKMKDLTALTLNYSHLTDLSDLFSLSQLQELSIEGNSLTTLHGIGHFSNLRTLLAGDNFITSIANCGLDSLTNLQVLALDNNEIVVLTPLATSFALKQLFVSGNKVTSYQSVLVLSELPDLKVLDLRFNPLRTQLSKYRLRIVYHLHHLAYLDGVPVSANEMVEAKEALDGRLSTEYLLATLGLESPGRVTHIDYEDSGIRTIELTPSEAFFNLHTINLQNNRLTSFDGLLQLQNLKVLWLPENRISSFASSTATRDCMITYLPRLAVLSLARNEITSLIPLCLSRFSALRTLFLQDNAITSLAGLIQMTSLRHLVLDRNKIRKIFGTELTGLNGLVELHLEDNRLQEMPSLEQLEGLEHLYLGGNRLESLECLVENFGGLCKLTHLGLYDNPLSKSSFYRLLVCHHLPKLLSLDGVDITPREIQAAENLCDEHEAHFHVNAAFDSDQILFSPLNREKRFSRSVWRGITPQRVNLPPMLKLPGASSTEVTAKQTADNTTSSPSLLMAPAPVLLPTVLRGGVSLQRRSVAPKKVTKVTSFKNNCNRMVMSIPGISINAMAQFDSPVPNAPNPQSGDSSATLLL